MEVIKEGDREKELYAIVKSRVSSEPQNCFYCGWRVCRYPSEEGKYCIIFGKLNNGRRREECVRIFGLNP